MNVTHVVVPVRTGGIIPQGEWHVNTFFSHLFRALFRRSKQVLVWARPIRFSSRERLFPGLPHLG